MTSKSSPIYSPEYKQTAALRVGLVSAILTAVLTLITFRVCHYGCPHFRRLLPGKLC